MTPQLLPADSTPEQIAAEFNVSRESLEKLHAYVDLLVKWQQRINLIGPSTVDQIWRRHIADALQLIELMPAGAETVVDLGSGAGIPGLVFYLFIWGAVIRYRWKAYRHKGFSDQSRSLALAALLASVTFFTSSVTDATFADEEVRQLLMFFWAAGLAVWYKEGRALQPGGPAQTP